jgi:hypothetical protein
LPAANITSSYTEIAFQKTCKMLEEIEEGGSVTMLCSGHVGYPVHFAEGDLRHSLRFGYVTEEGGIKWQSFEQWNRIGTTVEWRIAQGRPFATILRWFIENTDNGGSADPGRVGQVLVVSRVGQPEDRQACVVGYVDALANADANVIARSIADTLTKDFRCGTDAPAFHGKRGKLSGTPS